eukprot:4458028-Ditylum_brightwellii.AAC.1
MPLTATQTASFFEDVDQMNISHATVVQLVNKGINAVVDLADFDKSSIKQIAENLKRPAGRIPDPTPGAAPGTTIPTPLFTFGAKSQQRLLVACELIWYYDTVDRRLTPSNLRWAT